MTKNIYTCRYCSKSFSSSKSLGGHISNNHSLSRKINLEKKKKEKTSLYKNINDVKNNIFLDNKYTRCYYNLIKKARKKSYTDYTEIHHIIPRSLGGSEKINNKIVLSAKEHYICHLLLLKMLMPNSKEYHSMLHALMIMKASKNNNRITSKLYEMYKSSFSKYMSNKQKGKNNSQYGTCYVTDFSIKECKKITLNSLEYYISLGWKKCRVIDFSNYDCNGERIKKLRKTIPNPNRKKNMIKAKVDGPYKLVTSKSFRSKSSNLSKIGFNFNSKDLYYEYRKIQLQLVFDKELLSYRKIREKYKIKSDQTITIFYKIFGIL